MGSGQSNQSGGGGGGGGGAAAKEAAGGAAILEPKQLGPEGDKGYDFESDPAMNPGGTLTGAGIDVAEAPASVTDSIVAYTGGYVTGGERFAGLNAEKMNKMLRDPAIQNKKLLEQARAFEKELNTSLGKLRNYKGEVYRLISNDSGTLQNLYEVGKAVKFNDFLSTSRSISAENFPFSSARSGIRFTIQSKTGKMIEIVSAFTREYEILMRSGTKFKITGKFYNESRGTWEIAMTEI